MNTGCQAEVLPDLSPAHALLSAAHQHPDRLSLIDAESARTFTLAQGASCVRTLAWYFTTLGLRSLSVPEAAGLTQAIYWHLCLLRSSIPSRVKPVASAQRISPLSHAMMRLPL